MAVSSDPNILQKDFRILTHLAAGSFGEVKLACHIPTKTTVAVKILRKKSNVLGEINSEAKILQSLEHSNIIKFFHIIDTWSRTYIVMEYVAGKDLKLFISEVGHLKEQEARPIFQQVVSAVHFLHQRCIAHRDIKLENILIDGYGKVKLCDFGLAIQLAEGQMLKKVCGSLLYMAPEILAREPYDGLARRASEPALPTIREAGMRQSKEGVEGGCKRCQSLINLNKYSCLKLKPCSEDTVPEGGVLMANVIQCATGDIGDNMDSVGKSPGDLSLCESLLNGRPTLFLNMDFLTEKPSMEPNMPHNQPQIRSTTSASRPFKGWKRMRKRISHVLGGLLICVMPVPE
ncbi:hypothetical protein U0070_010861 [Myodes glareolus]|uniref:non-specific serine/threonine protein kinase n=1 Tax=Myodes glareolus TaxID=447135 RepID=A0AAW0H1V4_MYOGA